jgi:hypothetical protein
MNDELKCPFCGGKVRILVCDDEGNVHDDDYENDPWSGLSFGLAHDESDAIDRCPIANFDCDEKTFGVYLYDTRKDAIEAWSKRV